jgi:hypothetical protein
VTPGSDEQRLEERFDRLISEMDDLLVASKDSPAACHALNAARKAIIALEHCNAA